MTLDKFNRFWELVFQVKELAQEIDANWDKEETESFVKDFGHILKTTGAPTWAKLLEETGACAHSILIMDKDIN